MTTHWRPTKSQWAPTAFALGYRPGHIRPRQTFEDTLPKDFGQPCCCCCCCCWYCCCRETMVHPPSNSASHWEWHHSTSTTIGAPKNCPPRCLPERLARRDRHPCHCQRSPTRVQCFPMAGPAATSCVFGLENDSDEADVK
jgi:hypothetical protein